MQTCSLNNQRWVRTTVYSNSLMSTNWRRQWHSISVLLPGKSHGRPSLVGCSLWSRWESGTTERLHFHFSLSCIGEGNGNPLQCSCLENPRHWGAWWAAIYGVARSQTRLNDFPFTFHFMHWRRKWRSCLENPRDGVPGGLPSLGLHRVRHDWSDLAAAAAYTHILKHILGN